MCFKGLRTVPLWADPAPGCGVTAASSSCTGDTAPHNTASASAADPPLPQPAAAAGTPSDAPTTPASPALALTDSRSVPWGITAVFSLARSIILTRQNELIAGGVMKKKTLVYLLKLNVTKLRSTSLSCSLRWRYCRFWESSRPVSSFFCCVRMCCWNFFSSDTTAFPWRIKAQKHSQLVILSLISALTETTLCMLVREWRLLSGCYTLERSSTSYEAGMCTLSNVKVLTNISKTNNIVSIRTTHCCLTFITYIWIYYISLWSSLTSFSRIPWCFLVSFSPSTEKLFLKFSSSLSNLSWCSSISAFSLFSRPISCFWCWRRIRLYLWGETLLANG